MISALIALAANSEENKVLLTQSQSETELANVEAVKQLQGLSIFISDIREELIGNILKPLVELEKTTADPNATPLLARYGKLSEHWQEELKQAELLVKEGQVFF